MNAFDWNDARLFLAIAEAGSLSGAAQKLGASQPTLGRRVDALEAALGLTLFRRGVKGMRLTEAGEALLEEAAAMRAAADRLSLRAAGRAEAVEGVVRIAASRIVAAYRLPEIIADLMAREPGLEIELVADDGLTDLSRREADIALRMRRPDQPGLVMRKAAEFRLALYAAKPYLARRGAPRLDDLAAHEFVDYDANPMIRNHLAARGLAPRLRARVDDQVVNWRLVVAGAGIGAQQCAIGDAEPEVERVLTEAALPSLPVWLVCHEELRRSARMRRVFDFLAEALKHMR